MNSALKYKIYLPEAFNNDEFPIFNSSVQAGFPSPAEDYSEERLDIGRKLISNPSSTFFVQVNGESMNGDGISHGDLLIVDKSITPKNDSILVCFINGEFTLKRIKKNGQECYLIPSNPDFKPIEITQGSDFRIWGVVTFSIKTQY